MTLKEKMYPRISEGIFAMFNREFRVRLSRIISASMAKIVSRLISRPIVLVIRARCVRYNTQFGVCSLTPISVLFLALGDRLFVAVVKERRRANELWNKRSQDLISKNYGALVGRCLANFKNNNGKPDKGLNRLFRILISESMFHDIVLSHLVFHIMYKDPTKTHSAYEIHNEWLQAINSRPKIHCKNCGD